jgi:uncharacterized paraquat-inducible protein A
MNKSHGAEPFRFSSLNRKGDHMPFLHCAECDKRKFVELEEVKRGHARCPDCQSPFTSVSIQAGLKASQVLGCSSLLILVALGIAVYYLLVK